MKRKIKINHRRKNPSCVTSALGASVTSNSAQHLQGLSPFDIECLPFRYLLKAHQMTHNEEKRYECDVCHKKFALKKTLQVHETSHKTDKGPYKCSYCPKSFRYVANLNTHELIHTGINYNNIIFYLNVNLLLASKQGKSRLIAPCAAVPLGRNGRSKNTCLRTINRKKIPLHAKYVTNHFR